MGSSTDQSFGRAWDLARRQHGVVARRQLLALGMSEQSIQHRIGQGRLHRVERGIYAVGRPELTRHGRWLVAVMSCGSRAALSHASAAALWGLSASDGGRIEVSVPFASPRRRPGVHVYRRPNLEAKDVVERERIPVIVPVLTLIDLARTQGDAEIERLINAADKRDLIDPGTLELALDAYPGRPGISRIRRVLGRRSFRLTDSELERRFLRLVESAGLPTPLTGHPLNGFKVDFFWPELGLVVETDGLRYHRTPAQQARDRLRDQAHTAAGLTTLRFTHAQVCFEAPHVRSTLLAVVRRLQARRAA
jgi:very-short-patch-repair endonuclease